MEKQDRLFVASGFLFRMGLALETFEEVRPRGVLAGDYFFALSLLLLLCSQRRRLLRSRGSGVLVVGALILCGGLLSSVNASGVGAAAGPLTKLFILYGLFAPLAVAHSKDIRRNMLFLMSGVFANCIITMLDAWVLPGITGALAINPMVPTELDPNTGRFMGLTGHPNILGLSAALAVLIGVGLLFSEKNRYVRWGLFLHILVCTVAALLSGSRTFFVSLIPGLFVLALMQKQGGRLLARALIGVVVLWGGMTYLAPDLVSQYAGRLGATSADDTENYGRVWTAAAATVEISQKPILGWGADRFGEAGLTLFPGLYGDEPQGAHVSFLQYWYAAGLLAAVGFLAVFVIPVRRMIRVLKSNGSGDSGNTLRLGLSVYVLLFITSNVQPILYNRFLYMPLFVFAGYAAHAAAPIKARKTVRRIAVHLRAPNVQATS